MNMYFARYFIALRARDDDPSISPPPLLFALTVDPSLAARNPSPTFGIEPETVTLRVVFLVVRDTS